MEREVIIYVLYGMIGLCVVALIALFGFKVGFDTMENIKKPVDKATKDLIKALEDEIDAKDKHIDMLKRKNDALRLEKDNLRVYVRELKNGNR